MPSASPPASGRERNGREKGARFPLRRGEGEEETVWLEVEGDLSPREVSLVRLLLAEWERRKEEPSRRDDPSHPLVEGSEDDILRIRLPASRGFPGTGAFPFSWFTAERSEGQGSGEIRRILVRYFEGKTWILPLDPGELLLLVPWATGGRRRGRTVAGGAAGGRRGIGRCRHQRSG